MKKQSMYWVTGGLFCALLSACGGGGGGTSTTQSTTTPSVVTPSTGLFVDAPVAGIKYRTATQSGTTDAEGKYQYLPGEFVTFSIGNADLPTVAANGVVTPLDLVGTTDPNDQKVVNILVLLQSLDEDGNPGNGIKIASKAHEQAPSSFTFDLPPATFAAHSAITALVANSGSVTKTPISDTAAKAHFNHTLKGTGGVAKVNVAPAARALAKPSVLLGDTVTLDGSGSGDANGDALTYSWTLNKPNGSSAALSNPASPKPTFTPDVEGEYTATLVVNDGQYNSAAATAKIVAASATKNAVPVAHAGSAQSMFVGGTLQLDATASSDANGDKLTYAWTLTSKPSGSTATLVNPTSDRPSLTSDKAGTYVATLVVNDGKDNSAPATVTLTAYAPGVNVAPVAKAGSSQSVLTGATVALDGSASSDANGDKLTYAWTLTSKPSGSTANLVNPTSDRPSLTSDKAGTYVATLVVNDGKDNSAPVTVAITVTDPVKPVEQVVPVSLLPAGTQYQISRADCPTVTAENGPMPTFADPDMQQANEILAAIDPAAHAVLKKLPADFAYWMRNYVGTGKVNHRALAHAIHETNHGITDAFMDYCYTGERYVFRPLLDGKVHTTEITATRRTALYSIVKETYPASLLPSRADRYGVYITPSYFADGNRADVVLDELTAYANASRFVVAIFNSPQHSLVAIPNRWLDADVGGMLDFMMYLQSYIKAARLSYPTTYTELQREKTIAYIQTLWTFAEKVLVDAYPHVKDGNIYAPTDVLAMVYTPEWLAELDALGIKSHKTAADWSGSYLK